MNAHPMLPELYRVLQNRSETSDTFTLDLEPLASASPFSFLPGQFNMLYVFGAGEVPISISGDRVGRPGLVHTVRAVGAATKGLKKSKRGDLVGVRGPFGSSWPVTQAEGNDVVLVAGGIGLAPLRPALYHILRNRQKYGKVCLLYGTRTPDDILYRRELTQWRGRLDTEIEVTVDRAVGPWQGRVGVVTKLIPRASFDPESTVAMICGPEIMMRFTIHELEARGVPDENIFISMERNMLCAVGLCGHCQFGPMFICKDGPIFALDHLRPFFGVREL